MQQNYFLEEMLTQLVRNDFNSFFTIIILLYSLF